MKTNPLAYVEAAVAALVVVWLAAGLFANPLLFGAVALLAVLPLVLVVLPALAVRALGDHPVTVRTGRSRRSATGSPPPSPGRGTPIDD